MKPKHPSAMLYRPQSALHGICNAIWDKFKMADEQLSYNFWFSSQQFVYMASNAKKKK